MILFDTFRQLRSLYLFSLFLPFLCHNVAANTEIINFSPSREPLVDLPSDVVGNWSDLRLHPSENERRWTLAPAALHTPLHQVCERTDDDVNAVAFPPIPFRARCPHELWVLLDLDDERWASYAAFTLRLSWAASTPADIVVSLYSPHDLLDMVTAPQVSTSPAGRPAQAPTTTRARYARIRAVHAGVSVPTPAHAPPPPPPGRGGLDVPFVLVLEPLYMGVLPASLLSTVGFLILVVLAAAWTVPWVTAYLDPFVRQAREDDAIGASVEPSASRSSTNKLKLKDR